jgi:hypothetical protein
MRLTPDAFQHWETELAERVFSSEYDIPVDHALELPLEQRFAHIARLLRSLCMDYGIRTDYGMTPEEASEVLGEVEAGGPAWILDHLDRASFNATDKQSAEAV